MGPVPGPSLHETLPGPKAPGQPRESAGVRHNDSSYGYLPCARHTTEALGEPLTSLSLSFLICKMGLL